MEKMLWSSFMSQGFSRWLACSVGSSGFSAVTAASLPVRINHEAAADSENNRIAVVPKSRIFFMADTLSSVALLLPQPLIHAGFIEFRLLQPLPLAAMLLPLLPFEQLQALDLGGDPRPRGIGLLELTFHLPDFSLCLFQCLAELGGVLITGQPHAG